MPLDGANLTAEWTANEYSITYALGGGSGSVPTDSTNYHIGDTVTVEFTPLPARTGYTFAGWSDGATTYTSGGTESFTMGSSNVTLTAQWTAINYTVTYALGGGSGSVPTDSTNYHIGDTVTVKFTPLPTRTGYTFAGWSDGATTYTSGSTESFTMGSSNVTLTAQWTANEYTVTYALGGGSGSVPTDSTNYHIGDTVTVEFTPLPTRTGYTFAGWSDGATTYTSGGTESFTMGSSNVTLTAQWTAINYTVTYALGGGSGSVPTDSTNYHIGDTVTVEFTPLPTRTGYTFAGWSDGATTYTSGGTESFTMGSSNVTLTAQWTANEYTVTYALGGGSGSVPTDSTNYHIGDTVTVEFTPLPTRTGYTFVGWSDGATTYTSGGTESFTMGSSNVTLTAEWTANEYTVTYALGGGSGSVPTDSTNYHIGDTVTVEFTPLPARTGYTFAGWSDAPPK